MPVKNGVMMQYFHWYSPADGSLWNEARSRARELAQVGITGIWLPPAYKGTGGANDVGYGVYDMYDLGEFDQKGSVRTGTGRRTSTSPRSRRSGSTASRSTPTPCSTTASARTAPRW